MSFETKTQEVVSSLHGAKLVLQNGDPITELRMGSTSRALDEKTGEINAFSQQDLLHQIGKLMQASASGQIRHQTPQEQNSNLSIAAKQARAEVLADAMADPEKWAALGASIADAVVEQANREGFLRKIAVGIPLSQGEIARIPMPQHDVMAVVATSSSSTGYQTVRTRLFTPDEFEIHANIRVESLDIDQINGDILERAYNDGLEAIMVCEDKIWKSAADKAVGVVNNLEYIASELTTKNLGALTHAISRWNLPAATAIVSSSYWQDIIGSNDFATFLDPISKYDLVTTGRISTMLGLDIITDAFRQPNQKVLNEGEMYVMAAPENHAAYTTRGGVRSTPTHGANSGNSTRGWFMTEPFSFVLTNPRSVVKAMRR